MEQKEERLREIPTEIGSVLVAFSGGVDSTYLLAMAAETLGPRAVAVTARSEVYPLSELEQARRLARELGVRHLEIETSELSLPGFADNPPDRCYHCQPKL